MRALALALCCTGALAQDSDVKLREALVNFSAVLDKGCARGQQDDCTKAAIMNAELALLDLEVLSRQGKISDPDDKIRRAASKARRELDDLADQIK